MFVGDRHRRAIEKFLKPIKVTLLHQQGKRVRPILGVEWKTPSQVMFVLRNQDEEMSGRTRESRNAEISVQVMNTAQRGSRNSSSSLIPSQTYLKQYHNYTVKHHHWPCIKISRNAIVPMELCEVIEGQQFRGALSDVHRSEMLKLTTLRPSERFKRIEGSEQVSCSSVSWAWLTPNSIYDISHPISSTLRGCESPLECLL